MIKYLLEDQVLNAVDTSIFPWVKEPLPEEIGAAKAASSKATSKSASNPLHHSLQPEILILFELQGREEEYRRNGPRVILFMLGGITFAEIRATHEVMKDSKRDIIIGRKKCLSHSDFSRSTDINNPTQYIRILKELHKPEGYNSLDSQALASSLSNLVDAGSSPKGSLNALSPSITATPEAAKDAPAKEEKE
ncbi:hypothetical protein BC829DRAFT_394673 [Chytridium lagenaria]|nr:hypothetical protein BC829DRAFT_394673 [Chytridium lagenaria]